MIKPLHKFFKKISQGKHSTLLNNIFGSVSKDTNINRFGKLIESSRDIISILSILSGLSALSGIKIQLK